MLYFLTKHGLTWVTVAVLVQLMTALPTSPIPDARWKCKSEISKFTNNDCEVKGNVVGCYHLVHHNTYRSCAGICNDVLQHSIDEERCNSECPTYYSGDGGCKLVYDIDTTTSTTTTTTTTTTMSMLEVTVDESKVDATINIVELAGGITVGLVVLAVALIIWCCWRQDQQLYKRIEDCFKNGAERRDEEHKNRGRNAGRNDNNHAGNEGQPLIPPTFVAVPPEPEPDYPTAESGTDDATSQMDDRDRDIGRDWEDSAANGAEDQPAAEADELETSHEESVEPVTTEPTCPNTNDTPEASNAIDTISPAINRQSEPVGIEEENVIRTSEDALEAPAPARGRDNSLTVSTDIIAPINELPSPDAASPLSDCSEPGLTVDVVSD